MGRRLNNFLKDENRASAVLLIGAVSIMVVGIIAAVALTLLMK